MLTSSLVLLFIYDGKYIFNSLSLIYPREHEKIRIVFVTFDLVSSQAGPCVDHWQIASDLVFSVGSLDIMKSYITLTRSESLGSWS